MTEKKTNLESKEDEKIFDENGEFNPQRYDHESSRCCTKDCTNRRAFDKKGELNAQNDKDALKQIQHILDNLGNEEQQSEEDSINVENLSDEAIKEIGEEISLYVNKMINYSSLARKLLRIRELGNNEIFRVAVNPASLSYIINADKEVEKRTNSKWITPPEIYFPSYQDMPSTIESIKKLGDSVLKDIVRQEDQAAIALYDIASTVVNKIIKFDHLTTDIFEEMGSQIRRNRFTVDNFYISPHELSDVIKYMSTDVDPECDRDLIIAGYIGTILDNASIITTTEFSSKGVIPAGTVYAATDSNYVGEFRERLSVFSEPHIKRPRKGLVFMEMAGLCLFQPKAITKGIRKR